MIIEWPKCENEKCDDNNIICCICPVKEEENRFNEALLSRFWPWALDENLPK